VDRQRQNLPRDVVDRRRFDGRAAGTVTYMLTPEANGTRFVREFTYGVPSLSFALVNSMLLKGTIQSESDDAVNRLKRLLENIALP
jgi:hypothetical protein